MTQILDFSYSTPALLYPAISLLFLAFTNRFISYADLIRNLHKRWQDERSSLVKDQIQNLRIRMALIRWMQVIGALALVSATVCMFLLFLRLIFIAEIVFSIAIVLMMISLMLLVIEILISMKALDIQLNDMS